MTGRPRSPGGRVEVVRSSVEGPARAVARGTSCAAPAGAGRGRGAAVAPIIDTSAPGSIREVLLSHLSEGGPHASEVSPRFHADRAAGRHRHHRRPDRPAPARRAGGPRGGPADAVRQQPQADRARPAQLPHRRRRFPMGVSKIPLLGARRHRLPVGLRSLAGWSAQALLLGYLDQVPMYNAANFSWCPGASGNMGGSASNSTIYNTVLAPFLCPSDPNAGRCAITATTRASGRPPTRARSTPRGCSRSSTPTGSATAPTARPTPSPSPRR